MQPVWQTRNFCVKIKQNKPILSTKKKLTHTLSILGRSDDFDS